MKKVLICEDDSGIREAIKIFLELKGLRVREFDGNEGDLVTIAREFSPDIILMDLGLPHKSGEELINEIKQDCHTSHIPVLVVSASDDIRRVVQRSHVADYLKKPFEIRDLETKVFKYLAASVSKV